MWFDRNLDGRFQAGEWPLPGIRVSLTSTTSQRMAIAESAAHATSGTDGHYAFADVSPGAYTIAAVYPKDGFAYTSDLDWSAAIIVTGSGVTGIDFAGVGQGTIRGTVLTGNTQAPISGAQVSCRWVGLDEALNTPDDVLMAATATTAGAFDLPQLPYGVYSCTAVDPASGDASAATRVIVRSTTPVAVELAIGPALADTGPKSPRVVWLGFLLVVTGATLLLATRRQPERSGRG